MEAVAYHHTPARAHDERFGVTATLHAALASMDRVKGGNACAFDEAFIEQFDKMDRIPAWIELVETNEYNKENG